jgi:hypothetical protein
MGKEGDEQIMAYGSDFRVKYLMRETQRKVTKKLKEENIDNPLHLRIFDESDDDQKLWIDGGLTFSDEQGLPSGSNDAAWYLEKQWKDPLTKKTSSTTPVLIVEGTFGTETGNTGDAQKTKVSHVASLPIRGLIGAIIMPKVSEYYKKDKKEKHSKPTYYSKAYWFEEIVLAALALTKQYDSKNGKFLLIDAYDKDLIFELVYSIAKNIAMNSKDTQNTVNSSLAKILDEMNEYTKCSDFWDKCKTTKNGIVLNLPMKNNQFSDKWVGRIHKDDRKAFGIVNDNKNVQSFRNGHRLLGNVLDLHILTQKNSFLIMPRFLRSDCTKIDSTTKSGKKEWDSIKANPHLDILTLDEIDFGKHYDLEKNFKNLYKKYLSLDTKMNKTDDKQMNIYVKELKLGFLKKEIKLKK